MNAGIWTVSSRTEYPDGRTVLDEQGFDSEDRAWETFLDIAASVDLDPQPGSSSFSYRGSGFETTVSLSERKDT